MVLWRYKTAEKPIPKQLNNAANRSIALLPFIIKENFNIAGFLRRVWNRD